MSSSGSLTSASSVRKRLMKDEDMTKVEFETSEEVDVTPTFDTMGLREDLLRGIYAYGVRQPCNVAAEHDNQAFGMGGRLRKLKFADEELRILAEQVVAEEPRLFGSRTQKTSTREKSIIWDEITGRINAVAAVPRTTEEVKKRWQDLKCRVRTLASEHRRAVIAGGSAPPLILRSWEKMVLQILDPSSMEIFSRVDYGTETRQFEGTAEQDENAMGRGDDSEDEWTVPIITHRVSGSATAPKANQMILTTSCGGGATSGNNAHRQTAVLPNSQQQSTSTSGVSSGWLSTQPTSSPQDSSAGSSVIPPPVDMIDEVLANLSPRDVVCLLRRVLRLPPSSTECEDVNTSPVGSPRTADVMNASTRHETPEGTQPTLNQPKLDISTKAIDQVLARLTAIEAQQKIQTAIARDQLQVMQRMAAAADDIAMTNTSVANANVGLSLERLAGVVERIAGTISCMCEVLEKRQHSSVEMEVSDLPVQNSQTIVPFTSSEMTSEESNLSSSRRSLRAAGLPYPPTGQKAHTRKK